jgi:hypothetical protein
MPSVVDQVERAQFTVSRTPSPKGCRQRHNMTAENSDEAITTQLMDQSIIAGSLNT